MTDRIFVRRKGVAQIDGHNDLQNAAFHFKRVLEQKIAAKDRVGGP